MREISPWSIHVLCIGLVAIVIGLGVSFVKNGSLVDPEVTLVVDFEFDP